jgi:hypothetical protein
MNVPFSIAFGITILAVILHTFTFEHWIWPTLTSECFPTTPFTDKPGTKSYFRLTWHFFTVMFLMTIGALFALAFVDGFAGQNVAFATYLGIQWLLILISMFVNTYVALVPGTSFVSIFLKSWQWLIALALVVLIFWGIKVCH